MPEGYSNTDWLAGNAAEGAYVPFQLFTAEDEIKTGAATVLTGQIMAVFTIVAFNAANKLVPWAPAAMDVTNKPVGIMAADVNTGNTLGGTNADTILPFYEGGCFNPDVLVWPAALDTYAERNAALRAAGAPFRVKRLL